MRSNVPPELDFPLERRIGKPSATKLEKHLGLTTVGDLLHHFPRRYMERGELTPIAEIPFDEDVTLIARVQSANARRMQTRKGTLLEVTVTDDASGALGLLHLTFFNGWTAQKDLTVGTRAMFSGKVGVYKKQLTLTNPNYVVLNEEADDEEEAKRPIPLYPAATKLNSWDIKKAVDALLLTLQTEELHDPIPESIRQREHLLGLVEAYEKIHRPAEVGEAYKARHRFRYQEALVLQTALARRRSIAAQEDATARPPRTGGLLDRFDAALPFTLTNGQAEVGRELAADLARPHPMNRLLQGEVGSGKTLVALRAMLQVIDAGGQAALLAPTEVLAAQHYESITRTLGPLGQGGRLGSDEDATQVTLLTGSMNTAQRRAALLDAASGAAGIVVGTHALLSEHVQFADLGLVVVDEQHRFGVEQRDILRTKGRSTPHLLVMTATPIPRTVAMTVFGDLNVSTLSELPAGRAPISTFMAPLAENPAWARRIWERAREEIDAGRQVYVVCPKIGDKEGEPGSDLFYDETAPGSKADKLSLSSVAEMFQQLSEVPALAGVRIGILHGRLEPAEKTETMAAFNRGDIDLLISTTVIEVGVDVHNASMMVIMDADRFGISQLHQLRGRVGRGGLPGTCLLVTRLEPGHPSRERLEAVAATTDGFELSRKDLELRREGDILGASQSGGQSTLKLLRAIQDEPLIEKARADATALVEEDPDLTENPALNEAIEDYLNPEKEAFLERG
ncbi:ATP-dependent DNA helicase RecG [Arthrobacter sp. zg-Y820]|uniref:ATP-dependent DNA helicase RecG n=1 Tax=unclassified Arthrobacter TaxID=235627 RepID=UPI001E65979D|nr:MULTISPECIES: ATP-dependent DNA helicase RecG [unclassified Arthrobacter]MCC9196213.1 ATP-dependent DNA helicase RecG [Arthrobacter sp. zg-Y820]MDK1279073.1 ATP-dependent DNA helicase RecG [Arthrobacter sp. zg.Y820]MDK1359311.1 ATP-dependent DNA helicase RecG [Arthrobacter sp. zg-Y1219]WIB08519.1 ATP-dependent DNA helicase RecG [Arthrobacter sp. zg-Y820]